MLFKIIASVAILGLLCSCGGGGSDSEPSPQQGNVSNPANEVIDEINRFRKAAKLSAVKPNVYVMSSADNHAKYLALHPTQTAGHTELSGAPGFTGVNVYDRIPAAGYQSLALAVESVARSNGALKTPLEHLRATMNSPYHGIGLLYWTPDAGVGLATTSDGKNSVMVINLASKLGLKVYIPLGTVTMWPCNGVDNILSRTTAAENPNPIPGRNLETDPIGTPIYIMGNDGSKLFLSDVQIVNTVTGERVEIVKVLGSDVADGLPPNEMAVLPNKPLGTSTSYSATATGSIDGASFSKTCKFTTSASLT